VREQVKGIEVKRTDMEFLIGKSKFKDSHSTLTLFKNEDQPWIITDGFIGTSYFINDDNVKKRIENLNY
jgi:hypothetical protein